MVETSIASSSQRVARGQVREALDRLEGLVVDGLKHGFFDYSIACEVGNGGKRHLVIRAGKSQMKFQVGGEARRGCNAMPASTPALFALVGLVFLARRRKQR